MAGEPFLRLGDHILRADDIVRVERGEKECTVYLTSMYEYDSGGVQLSYNHSVQVPREEFDTLLVRLNCAFDSLGNS